MADEEKKDEKVKDVTNTPAPAIDTPEAEKVNAKAEEKPAGMGDGLAAAFKQELEAFGTRLIAALKEIVKGEEEAPVADTKPVDQKSDEHEAQAMKETATLEARLAAIELKESKRDEKDILETRIAEARKQLAGWPVTDTTVAKMRTIAEKDASGEALKAFVETYRTAVPKDPPARVEDATNSATSIDAPEVMDFAKEGPEVLAKARKFSALYDEAVKHNLAGSEGRKRYIEVQLRAERNAK